MEKSVIKVIIDEAFAVLNIPGAAAASEILNKILEKKAKEAKEILFEELRNGAGIWENEDEVVYIIHRYLRSAQEGSARLNLRLLAQSISGAYINKITANKFLYYADLIASLRNEEIIIIGSYYKNFKDKDFKDGDVFTQSMDAIKAELIPQLFETEDHLKTYSGALLRTGLIQAVSAWGGLIYKPTYLLFEIANMISIEEALTKEKILSI